MSATTEDQPVVIDLGEVIDPGAAILAGSEWGLSVRAAARLQEHDAAPDVPVEVRVPASVEVITTSFARGLFADSLAALGAAAFRAKYQTKDEYLGWLLDTLATGPSGRTRRRSLPAE